jgi:hypothetical protein
MHTIPEEDSMTTAADTYRELASRAADGVEVGLFWSAASGDRLLVVVDDTHSGDLFELEVSGAEALDAFEHPYAYAAHRGVRYAVASRAPVYA